MGTGRNLFLVCHVHLQVAGHSRGNNYELFVKRLENYLIIIKRYINRNYYYYYYSDSSVKNFLASNSKSLCQVPCHTNRVSEHFRAVSKGAATGNQGTSLDIVL